MRAPARLLRIAGVLICWLPQLVAAQAVAPSELMRLLASAESSRATFVETRHSVLLKAPLVLHGTLAYRRPDRLEKHVLQPHDERLVLEGDRLTIDNRTRARKLTTSVAGSPAIAAMAEGIRATRAGDLAALERHFEIKVDGRREAWSMSLRPTSEQVSGYVSAIVVTGAGSRITRFEVQETSGDRVVTEIREEIR